MLAYDLRDLPSTVAVVDFVGGVGVQQSHGYAFTGVIITM